MAEQPTTPITKSISIGGLLAFGYPEQLETFGLIISAAKELANYVPSEDPKLKAVLLNDDDRPDLQEKEIFRGVDLIAHARGHGQHVLVTCAEGRNRSALLVAEYIIQRKGEAAKVIRHIQSTRKGALTNTAFVSWWMRSR